MQNFSELWLVFDGTRHAAASDGGDFLRGFCTLQRERNRVQRSNKEGGGAKSKERRGKGEGKLHNWHMGKGGI